MRIYELNCLVSAKTTESDLKELTDSLSQLISKNEGKVEKTTEPVKKFLSFRLKKETEVSFLSIIFSISPENLIKLEKEIKGQEKISRYNIIKRKRVEPEKEYFPRRNRKPIAEKKEKDSSDISDKKSGQEETKPKKVDLKKIDEKIDEMLQ